VPSGFTSCVEPLNAQRLVLVDPTDAARPLQCAFDGVTWGDDVEAAAAPLIEVHLTHAVSSCT
jgi:hypothetical protein